MAKRGTKEIPVIKRSNGVIETTTVEVPTETTRPIRRSTVEQNEDSRPERQATANDIFKAFGPQAIGMLVGGLLGGTDGAVAGGQQGAIAGQSLNTILNAAQSRTDKRSDAEFTQELALDTANDKREQNAVQNFLRGQTNQIAAANLQRRDIKNNLIDPVTNQPLVTDKFGNVFTLDGTEFKGAVRNLDDDKFKESQERTGIARQNLEEREKSRLLSAERLAFARFNKDEVSDKQAQEFADIAGGVKASQRVEELYNAVSTGPVSGRAQAAAEFLGVTPEEFTKLKTATGMQLVGFIKKTSGVAVSEPEAKRLQSLISSVNDPAPVFMAKLKEFQEDLYKDYATKAGTIQKLQGKRVVPLQELLSATDTFRENNNAGPSSKPMDVDQLDEFLFGE